MNTVKIIIIAAMSYGISMAARCFAGSSSDNTRAPAFRQTNRADRKTEHLNRGDDQRRDIDRAVLPQFAPDRPVERPRSAAVAAGGGDPGSLKHGVRFGIH